MTRQISLLRFVRRNIAAALALTATACATDELGPEYREISEDESGLQFYGPGLAGGYRKFLAGSDSQFVGVTIGIYGPRNGNLPWAELYFVALPTQRVFTRATPLRDLVEDREIFAGQEIAMGTEGSAINKLGRAEFITFTADDQTCVAWQQVFGPTYGGGLGRQSLEGTYCRQGSEPMQPSEAAAIVKLTGHRKFGSIAPPPDWPGSR